MEIKCYENKLLHTDDDYPAYQSFHKNGNIMWKTWYKKGIIHRDNNPADEEYYENGKIQNKTWYQYGKIYRENNLPTSEGYDINSRIIYKSWTMNNITKIIYYNDEKIIKKEWYQNGMLHRDIEPAIYVYYDNGKIKEKHWYQCGKIHRNDNLPSKELFNEDGEITKLSIDELISPFNPCNTDNDCYLCYQNNDNMIITDCHHVFCYQCIQKYTVCPYCYRKL